MGNLLKILTSNRFCMYQQDKQKNEPICIAIVVEFVWNFTYDNVIQQI